MAYSYTNRHGKTHYFRAVETKTGKYQYYVTISDEYPNLIEAIPSGYEVAELPEDAKVVIRKVKPVAAKYEEKEILQAAIAEFSAIKDFFIHAEGDYLYVYHSQFNYAAGQEPSLTKEEAMEIFGDSILKWMRFMTGLRFQLVDKKKRLFQTERVVYTGFYERPFYPIGEVGLLEDVARKFGQHLGRSSFLDIPPKGYE